MANWTNPLITTKYDVFVAEAKERDVDAGTMFVSVPTNPPVGSVRFNRPTKTFEEWNGSAWIVLVIAVASGGTGAGTGAGAGAALGLGSMAYQNSNAVAITGGSLQSAWLITNLIVPPTDMTLDIGDFTAGGRRVNKCIVAGGMVIPVGVDKYVVG